MSITHVRCAAPRLEKCHLLCNDKVIGQIVLRVGKVWKGDERCD
jgi:hypothetical protein